MHLWDGYYRSTTNVASSKVPHELQPACRAFCKCFSNFVVEKHRSLGTRWRQKPLPSPTGNLHWKNNTQILLSDGHVRDFCFPYRPWKYQPFLRNAMFSFWRPIAHSLPFDLEVLPVCSFLVWKVDGHLAQEGCSSSDRLSTGPSWRPLTRFTKRKFLSGRRIALIPLNKEYPLPIQNCFGQKKSLPGAAFDFTPRVSTSLEVCKDEGTWQTILSGKILERYCWPRWWKLGSNFEWELCST